MKLYNFEKYYLFLAQYKIYLFFKKVWGNIAGRYFLIFIWVMTSVMISGILIAYFFTGVNVFLENVHLEKYRIEEVNFMNSKLDLKQFYNK
ncbi:MAG: hypothetical protein Q8P26_01210 [Candidatus Levybacteria bacterium]|nr:hypothetical protein [Candidatus Levybacteria bacterium]